MSRACSQTRAAVGSSGRNSTSRGGALEVQDVLIESGTTTAQALVGDDISFESGCT